MAEPEGVPTLRIVSRQPEEKASDVSDEGEEPVSAQRRAM
jgi:hypothetical protein